MMTRITQEQLLPEYLDTVLSVRTTDPLHCIICKRRGWAFDGREIVGIHITHLAKCQDESYIVIPEHHPICREIYNLTPWLYENT